jgi:hypothetical protein
MLEKYYGPTKSGKKAKAATDVTKLKNYVGKVWRERPSPNNEGDSKIVEEKGYNKEQVKRMTAGQYADAVEGDEQAPKMSDKEVNSILKPMERLLRRIDMKRGNDKFDDYSGFGNIAFLYHKVFTGLQGLALRRPSAASVSYVNEEEKRLIDSVQRAQFETLKPFVTLSPASRVRVSNAAVLMRWAKKRPVPNPDGTFSVKNETGTVPHPEFEDILPVNLSQVKPGETLELDKTETEALMAVDSWSQQQLRLLKVASATELFHTTEHLLPGGKETRLGDVDNTINLTPKQVKELLKKVQEAQKTATMAQKENYDIAEMNLKDYHKTLTNINKYSRGMYIPLRRQGKYAINVFKEKDGKTTLIAMITFKNRKEAQANHAKIKKQYPKYKVSDAQKLTYDQTAKKYFNAKDDKLNQAMFQFLDIMGGSEMRPGFEPFANDLARSMFSYISKDRSRRPQWQKADFVLGFEEDAFSGVMSSVISHSHFVASKSSSPAYQAALALEPDQRVRDFLESTIDYAHSPAARYSKIRSATFLWYLSSPASAFVNMTQILPSIAMSSGLFDNFTEANTAHAKSFAEINAAIPKRFGQLLKAKNRAALLSVKPEEFLTMEILQEQFKDIEGFDYERIIDVLQMTQIYDAIERTPQEKLTQGMTDDQMRMAARMEKSLNLEAGSLGSLGKKAGNAVVDLGAFMFAYAEIVNRLTTYTANRRMLQKKGRREQAIERLMSGQDAVFMEFYSGLTEEEKKNRVLIDDMIARRMVDRVHFIYDKMNRGLAFRDMWGVATQFQNFPFFMYNALYGMLRNETPGGRRAVIPFLAFTLFTAGIWGLPFGDDLEQFVKIFSSIFGVDLDPRYEMEKIMEDIGLQDTPLDLSISPLSAILGIDLTRRTGLGSHPITSYIAELFAAGSTEGIGSVPIPSIPAMGIVEDINTALREQGSTKWIAALPPVITLGTL